MMTYNIYSIITNYILDSHSLRIKTEFDFLDGARAFGLNSVKINNITEIVTILIVIMRAA